MNTNKTFFQLSERYLTDIEVLEIKTGNVPNRFKDLAPGSMFLVNKNQIAWWTGSNLEFVNVQPEPDPLL